MARDCPDRQRGTEWRNDGYAPRPIGSGDAVDREMEQLMQELSGGAANGQAPRRIEAAPGSEQDPDVKPWQQRPPQPPVSDVAPWQQRGREYQPRGDYGGPQDSGPPPWAAQSRARDNNNHGYASNAAAGGFAGGPAPWHQQQHMPYQAASSGPQLGYGYAGYSPYVPPAPGSTAGYGAQFPGLAALLPGTSYGAPPPPPPPPADGPPPPVRGSIMQV